MVVEVMSLENVEKMYQEFAEKTLHKEIKNVEGVKELYQNLEALSHRLGFVNTEKALPFARRVHEGKFRRGNHLPYLIHPLSIASMMRDLGIVDDEAWATGLLHDTVEDVPDCGFDEQPFSDSIKRRVHILDFKKGVLEKRPAQRLYMNGIISDDWITNLNKDLDRLHNLSTTKGAFTPTKLEDYLDETVDLFYPRFSLQQQNFPKYSKEFRVLEYGIKNYVNELEAQKQSSDEYKRVLHKVS